MKAPEGRGTTKHPGRRRRDALARAISDRLREFVRDNYKSQSEFGRKVGVPPNTVSGWFASKHAPDVPQLWDIAKHTNVNLNWLLLGRPPRETDAPLTSEHVPERLRAAIVAGLAIEFGGSDGAMVLERVLPPPEELLELVLDQFRSWIRAELWSRVSAFPGALPPTVAEAIGLNELSRNVFVTQLVSLGLRSE